MKDVERKFTEQFGRGPSGGRSFDLAFRQAQTAEARWSAAWDVVVHD